MFWMKSFNGKGVDMKKRVNVSQYYLMTCPYIIGHIRVRRLFFWPCLSEESID